MKKIILYIFFFFVGTFSFSQVNKNHFLPGEKMKFILYYGLVNGGYIDVELNSTVYENNQAYHAKLIAKTSGIADMIYKVKDEYQSYFNPETLLPYKSIRDISEGKYKRYDLAFFDHKNLKVVNSKEKVFVVPPDIRDMVSVFYHIRNTDFDKLISGDILKVNTFFDNEVFPFDMRYRGIVTIDTKKGQYRCYKLVPYVEPGRAFQNEDDMTIYLSADRNRVPIRVEFSIKVGSIKCDIIEYSGLKY